MESNCSNALIYRPSEQHSVRFFSRHSSRASNSQDSQVGAPITGAINSSEFRTPNSPVSSRSGSGVRDTDFVPGVDDQMGALEQIQVMGANLSCFQVGGERRVCLPQLLRHFIERRSGKALQPKKVEMAMWELNIVVHIANAAQLNALKEVGAIDGKSESCGLLRQTDAERLCAYLFSSRDGSNAKAAPAADAQSLSDGSAERLPPHLNLSLLSRTRETVPVSHECFGKCRGLLVPGWYCAANSRCIVCARCEQILDPEQFVCHSHANSETRTCHWGFDPHNWRSYLLLSSRAALDGQKGCDPPAERAHLKALLEQFKTKFLNPPADPPARPPVTESITDRKVLRFQFPLDLILFNSLFH